MVVSWAIAEIVRYSYYVAAAGAGAGGGVPRWLAWARYNFFWVLYVTGAGSEWVCMWRAWPELKAGGVGGGEKGWMWWVVGGMLVAWPICEFGICSLLVCPWGVGWRGSGEWVMRVGGDIEDRKLIRGCGVVVFPNQYTHMMALRRKMMRGKKKA